MRIGFLFNHDQIHQVAHSLPIAMALAASDFTGEIIVATTSDRMSREVCRLGKPLLGKRLQHVELRLSRRSKFLTGMVGAFAPAGKVLVYGDNLDFFRSLDILVVAEKTSLILKKRYGLKNLRIVHTRHGAGDRAIGFDRLSADFDHILCSGAKIRDRLVHEAAIPPERISIVGYPKFDSLAGAQPVRMAHKRPLVLYNPHPSPHLSSWYLHGRQVLDFFIDNEDYDLVFAPHVMLFERRFAVSIDKLRVDRPGSIAEKYLRSPNIHIDMGSRSSTDMSYTQAADIYLGDVSSQVYEFLYRPRPCLFLNSHGVNWQNDPNYEHWKAGPVIQSPAVLATGLREARTTHEGTYLEIQKAMCARSFDLTHVPSATRAAAALLRFAGPSAIAESALRHVA
jgi:hypothetical protein